MPLSPTGCRHVRTLPALTLPVWDGGVAAPPHALGLLSLPTRVTHPHCCPLPARGCH